MRSLLLGIGAAVLLAGVAEAQVSESKKKMGETSWACRSDKIIGAQVKNQEGQDLGKIEDLAIDAPSGRIAYGVLSFGGFLGLGDKHFAIPWSALSFESDRIVRLNIPKSQLESAQGFDKDRWPNMADQRWAEETHRHFGQRPYWEADPSASPGEPRQIVKASDIKGAKVKNDKDEDLGSIKDMIIDREKGRVCCGVLSFGGVLGMGDKLFALPWEKLNVVTEREGDRPSDVEVVRVNVDKETLERAPSFTDNDWPDDEDRAYYVTVYRIYEVPVYWD